MGEKIHYRIFTQIFTNGTYKWFPDFHLAEFATYIEYFGLAGKQDYDKGIKTKEAVYSKMGLNVMPVYPWMFAEDWHGYILKELRNVTVQGYSTNAGAPFYLLKTCGRGEKE